MRSEIGKLELDRTFEMRENYIKDLVNSASSKWGIECMRYEIKDINPPDQIRRSMELQAESERIKRSMILKSEGEKQSVINVAEGNKQALILNGQGKAAQITQEAKAIVESINMLASSKTDDSSLKLKLTERYIAAMEKIMSKSSIVMLPNSGAEGSFVQTITTGMKLYENLIQKGGAGKIAEQASLGQNITD